MTGSTPAVLGQWPDLHEVLTPAERRRCAALRQTSTRDAFIAAHVLVRVCAAAVAGLSARQLTVEQRCTRCGGSHGKPTIRELPELSVSLAHSALQVAAAAASSPVGVDVEDLAVMPASSDAWEQYVLAPAEQRALPDEPAARRRHLLRQWIRKESLVKAAVVSLEEVGHLDLAELPADDRIPPGGTLTTSWRGWRLVEWTDDRRSILGTVSCVEPMELVRLP